MTNLIKNKKFTRITALLLVVAVIFGTMFTLPVSAASGDKVTITFDYCYDSTGNIIKFQQTTVSDGYTVGTPGEELCKIFADGKEAYCIEPGHTLYSGNTLTEDGSTVWKNLGSAKQKAINLALLYGKPGSGQSLSGTEDQKWVATQLIVWEFVSGCRSTSEGYKCTNTKFIDGICAGGANPGVKSVYNAISKSLANYSTVPSFASAIASKAETYEMKYSDGKYTLTLTDSNSILSDFSFKTTGGVSAFVSGNKLTLTSSNPVKDTVTFNSAKSMPSVSGTTLVPYGDASLQDVITDVENDADPIRAYFKVKTSSGNLKLVKTSEDGNVANIEFTVKGNNYSKTIKTNSKGEFELTNLVPGNYTVTEITDSKYETQKSQTDKDKIYWVCSYRTTSRSECNTGRIPETDFYDAFTALMSKLKANKKYILDTLIKQIEMLKNRSNPEQESIYRINKEIADLSAKNHMLAKLHTKGILKDAEFTVQVTEISKKLQKLKDEHRKIISEDKNGELLKKLNYLNEVITDYVDDLTFHKDIFQDIVESITVYGNDTLKFRLTGGLELTEKIYRRERSNAV